MPFAATWMILEIITLSEISQIYKDKNDISYMWNLKKNYTNEFSYEIEETENKLKVTKDLKREGGID